MIEIIFWYFSFQLIHILTLPLCFDLFKNLFDKGYSINKSFSFLMLSFFVYFFTRIAGLDFSILSILLSLFTLFILSLLIFEKFYKNIIKILKELKKHIIISEMIFIFLFILALFFKSFRPDLDHGEGPMDFAYIQSILRSEKLPPPYPWLINTNLENVYYYFGHFSYAIMIKLSGVESSKGYVLALATTFSLIGLSSFSIGYNLTRNYRLAFLCMFLIAFGSSLLSLFHVVFALRPDIQFNITEYRIVNEGSFHTRFFYGGQLFWWSTRVIPWTITEFPWFSLLWGDLHAHFISYCFIFIFIHLILDILYNTGNGFEIFGLNLFEIFKKILFISISLGYMFPQFIWNYPLYVGFLAISLFFIFYDREKKSKFFIYFLISFFLIITLSVLLFFEPIKNLLEFNPKRSGINWEDLKTSLFNFLVLYGLQVFCIYTYLFYKIFNEVKSIKFKKILIYLTIFYFIIFFIIFFNYFENTIRFDKPIRINWLNIKSILYDFQRSE
ncbi:MAG: hypothetical protein KQA41_04365, partial [Candidatus Aenigmarchaeota archaeon]|nr:hypothetical protein [Candidatus Aenigmarchaeota archaeon]